MSLPDLIRRLEVDTGRIPICKSRLAAIARSWLQSVVVWRSIRSLANRCAWLLLSRAIMVKDLLMMLHSIQTAVIHLTARASMQAPPAFNRAESLNDDHRFRFSQAAVPIHKTSDRASAPVQPVRSSFEIRCFVFSPANHHSSSPVHLRLGLHFAMEIAFA